MAIDDRADAPASRRRKDFISEEDYTLGLAGTVSSAPECDSPGDSEFDADTEIELGLSFETDSEFEIEEDEESFDVAEGIVLEDSRLDQELPESSKVVASELPGPRHDQESDTAIH